MDANAEYVQKLRVTEFATDQDIQDALHQLFKSSPQGKTILSTTSPQGNINSTNDQAQASIIAATAISKIQLDNVLKYSLHSSLRMKVLILKFSWSCQ